MDGQGPELPSVSQPESDQSRSLNAETLANSLENQSKLRAVCFQSIEDIFVRQSITLRQHASMLEGLAERQEILQGQICDIQSSTNRYHHQFSEDLFGIKLRLEAMEKVVANNSSGFIEVPIHDNPIIRPTYQALIQRALDPNGNHARRDIMPNLGQNEARGEEVDTTTTVRVSSNPNQVVRKNAAGRYICPNCGLDFAPIYILRHIGRRICRRRALAWKQNFNVNTPDLIQL